MDGYRFAAPAAFGPNWSLILTSVNIWALTGRSNALAIVVVAPHLFSPQNSFHAACRQSFINTVCLHFPELYGKAW